MGGASGYTYTFNRNPKGTTDIDVVIVREGKNLKGRVLGLVLQTIGLKTAFENSIKATEARDGVASKGTRDPEVVRPSTIPKLITRG